MTPHEHPRNIILLILSQCCSKVFGANCCQQVRADTNFVELLDANPWLKSTRLVVKPDMLFGKRGKHDLVGLNLDFACVEAFIKARMGKVSCQMSADQSDGSIL